MTVDILEDPAQLRAIEAEWKTLVHGCCSATPFQLPAWLLTWWKHFGSGSLQTYVFRESGAFSGILPCFRHRWSESNQLTLIGSGLSDYLDPILPDSAVSLLDTQLRDDPNWQVIDWQDLSEASSLTRVSGVELRPDTPCSIIPLTGSFEEFWSARGKDLRRNLRRYSQRTRELGDVQFEAAAEPTPEHTRALIRLHRKRWLRQGEPGMIALNHAEAFLRDVILELARAGIAKFFSIRLDRDIVAIILAFLYRKVVFSYMSAFDPEFENLGTGRMLLYEALQWAFANGYTHWDFLRGEEEYKFSWGAEPVPKIRVYKSR